MLLQFLYFAEKNKIASNPTIASSLGKERQ